VRRPAIYVSGVGSTTAVYRDVRNQRECLGLYKSPLPLKWARSSGPKETGPPGPVLIDVGELMSLANRLSWISRALWG
jgi:hypothetical protein